jgi:anti-sigma factor RsiW
MTSFLGRVRFRRDHRWAPAHMSEFVDGELAARPFARLQRHIQECPECLRVLHSLERMLGLLHAVPVASSGKASDIAAVVRQRLRDDPHARYD